LNLLSIHTLFLILLILISSKTQADTFAKQSAGFRYTDNVYLAPEAKVADFYLLLNSRLQFSLAERALSLRLDYADYAKESDNDYAGFLLSTKFRSPDMNLKLFHKNYVNENAATSDTSFTHTGAGIDLEKEWTPNQKVAVTGSVGYENRFFHDFGGRNDHQVKATAEFDFNSNPRVTPFAYTDLGLILSSQAAYSATFFDFGGGAKGPITGNLMWLTDFDMRAVSYMNRIVNQTLETTKRRGTTQAVNITDNERTQTTTVGGGLRWSFEKDFQFESRINIANQSSNNPNFEYQNNEIYLLLSYTP